MVPNRRLTTITLIRRRLMATLVLVLLVSLAIVQGGAAPAYAETRDVKQIVIRSGNGAASAVLTLNYDSPITKSEAAKIERSLGGALIAPAARATVPNMRCGQSIALSNGHGKVDFQYRCESKFARAIWSVRLSSQVQSVVAGRISEHGMMWWRNGRKQSKNAPHPLVATNYVLHGNLNPMWNGDRITWQDTIEFQHKGGGRAFVVFAGEFTVG